MAHIAHLTQNIAPNLPPGSAWLNSGYILQPEFGTLNGAEYQSKTEGKGANVTITKRVKYDHPDLKRLATTAINKGYWALRKFCCPLFSGLFYCPASDFDELDAELQESRNTAHTANLFAEKLHSKRVTTVEIFPFPLDTRNPRVALRVGKTLHEHMSRLKESYTSDESNAYPMEIRNSMNLWKVLVGEQREIVRAAIDASNEQRPIMIARYGGRRGVKQFQGQIPEFDFGPIDRAIKLFAPAESAFT